MIKNPKIIKRSIIIERLKRDQTLILKIKYYFIILQKLSNRVVNLKKNEKDCILFTISYLIDLINSKILKKIF